MWGLPNLKDNKQMKEKKHLFQHLALLPQAIVAELIIQQIPTLMHTA
jgi:hypothetical protein